MDDAPLIAGRFRAVRPLAEGAPGDEFEAFDLETGERARLLLAAGRTDGFAEEMRRCASLGPPLLGAGVDGDRLWVAWAWLEIPSVFEMFRSYGTQLPAAVARAALAPLAAALLDAHAQGVTHGRLDPRRLLHDAASGRTYALDAGLARFVDAPRSPMWHPAAAAPPEQHDAIAFARIAGFLTRSQRVEEGLPHSSPCDRRFDRWRDAAREPPVDAAEVLADYERLMAERLDPPPPPPPEPPPPPPPPRPPWEALLAPLLDAPRREEAGDTITLTAGPLRIELQPDRIAAHGLTWLGADRRCNPTVAAHVVAAARLLAGAGPVGDAWRPKFWRPPRIRLERLEPWIVRVLRDAGLPHVETWPEDEERAAGPWWLPRRAFAAGTWFFGDLASSRRASVADGVLTLAYAHEAWITSHERGRTTTPYARLPCAALPADPALAVALVRGLLAASPAFDPRPVYVCRFCERAFDGLDFHAHLNACHGCAERHLHVVH
jgi:hypothetical protein